MYIDFEDEIINSNKAQIPTITTQICFASLYNKIEMMMRKFTGWWQGDTHTGGSQY
jgi:hypothetical protein